MSNGNHHGGRGRVTQPHGEERRHGHEAEYNPRAVKEDQLTSE